MSTPCCVPIWPRAGDSPNENVTTAADQGRRWIATRRATRDLPITRERSIAKGLPTGVRLAARLTGGRTWWAHFAFTRINTTPTILRKEIEDLRILGGSCARTRGGGLSKSPRVAT